jgi:hypothetical protein
LVGAVEATIPPKLFFAQIRQKSATHNFGSRRNRIDKNAFTILAGNVNALCNEAVASQPVFRVRFEKSRIESYEYAGLSQSREPEKSDDQKLKRPALEREPGEPTDPKGARANWTLALSPTAAAFASLFWAVGNLRAFF